MRNEIRKKKDRINSENGKKKKVKEAQDMKEDCDDKI